MYKIGKSGFGKYRRNVIWCVYRMYKSYINNNTKNIKEVYGLNPCLDNPNITNIIFEEGLTVIPENLCANTGITNITIPSSVKKIELWAFRNCTKLDKITILDNVTDMSYYSDSIFRNHNDNLTIYCYKDSVAANHAIKNNIKYVYLTKEENKENTENDKEKEEYEDKVTDNKIR